MMSKGLHNDVSIPPICRVHTICLVNYDKIHGQWTDGQRPASWMT